MDELCAECSYIVRQTAHGIRSLDDVCSIFGVADDDIISLNVLYEEEERDVYDESEEELSI
jgi:predicted ATPase